MLGLLEGEPEKPELSTCPAVKASLSPDALKKDCPCAAICLKMVSVVASGPPLQPQEQLKFLTMLLAAMVFKISLGIPVGPASKTTIWESPGAMEMAISMSSETSMLPLAVGVPS